MLYSITILTDAQLLSWFRMNVFFLFYRNETKEPYDLFQDRLDIAFFVMFGYVMFGFVLKNGTVSSLFSVTVLSISESSTICKLSEILSKSF